MVRIAITGVSGRMGKAILGLAVKDPDFDVVAALEARAHPLVGQTTQALVGTWENAITISDDVEEALSLCDVVIDFTAPGASLQHFRMADKAGKAMVIGTTGFTEVAMQEIEQHGAIPMVLSPNMSIGMNLMFDLAEKVSRVLKEGYDVEILEMHHRMKKDAPSGSALRLKNAVCDGAPEKKWTEVFGREGMIGERKDDEIGVMSLRGGDVVGEHTLFFTGMGERLEITHRAYSRDNFARGALLAAKWIASRKPGIYTMKDVLGLK